MHKGLFILLAALAPPVAAGAPLRVGGFVVAPIVSGDATAPLGGALRAYMEQEMVGRGAADGGVQLEWSAPTTFARAMANLKIGRIDILLLVSGARHLPVGYGAFSWSYLRAQPHLAVPRHSMLQAVQSLQQLSGMEIGWLGGSELPEGIRDVPIKWQLLAAPDWQLLNLHKLRAGRVQAVFFENEYSPRYFARQAGVAIELRKLPMPERAFRMAYSLKADPAAIAQFDRVGAAAFAGERFKLFLERYMKR